MTFCNKKKTESRTKFEVTFVGYVSSISKTSTELFVSFITSGFLKVCAVRFSIFNTGLRNICILRIAVLNVMSFSLFDLTSIPMP